MRTKKNYQWLLADLIAGIFFALAFAPFNFWPLIFVALTILFASWQRVSPRQAALRGYLFGIGCFGLGVSWVFVSIYTFGGANIFIAVLLTTLFCGFWALFPAIAGYLSVRIFGHFSTQNIFILPIIWILVEFIRGYWVLNGFPWLQIAYSQLDTIYAGFIPIIGAYGTGFLVALVAMIFVRIYHLRRFHSSLIISVFAILIAGYMLKGQQWTHAIGDPIKVTLIQGNIAQDKKWQPEFKKQTLDLYQDMTQQHWDSQVIFWPETAIPAFLHEVDEQYLAPLHQLARIHQTDLVVSLPVKDAATGQYFNSVLALGEGRYLYKKIHLLPFGEYLPLQPFSGFILNSLKILPVGSFSPGAKDQSLLVAGGYPFITTICYEDVFAEKDISRLSKAAYLVNVTNDGWFGDSIEPHQHMQIARMRALESGRYLVRATNTGLTAIVGPDGTILQQLPLFKTMALTAEIVPMSGITLITRIGDLKVILILVIVLGGIYIYYFVQVKMQRNG